MSNVSNIRAHLAEAERTGDDNAGQVTEYSSTGFATDTIVESTADAGVTIDGVLFKDDAVTTSGTLALTAVTGVLGFTASTAVTQATDKSTLVTCNASAGQITMHAEELAAAAEATFAVANTEVSITDILILSIQASGATAGAYTSQVNEVTNGSFKVTISNASAGALSEAIIVNFVVLSVTG